MTPKVKPLGKIHGTNRPITGTVVAEAMNAMADGVNNNTRQIAHAMKLMRMVIQEVAEMSGLTVNVDKMYKDAAKRLAVAEKLMEK